jgi:hypothetical protein
MDANPFGPRRRRGWAGLPHGLKRCSRAWVAAWRMQAEPPDRRRAGAQPCGSTCRRRPICPKFRRFDKHRRRRRHARRQCRLHSLRARRADASTLRSSRASSGRLWRAPVQGCSYPSQSGLVRGSVAAVPKRATRECDRRYLQLQLHVAVRVRISTRRRSLTAQLGASTERCEYRSNRYSPSTCSLIYLPYKSAI